MRISPPAPPTAHSYQKKLGTVAVEMGCVGTTARSLVAEVPPDVNEEALVVNPHAAVRQRPRWEKTRARNRQDVAVVADHSAENPHHLRMEFIVRNAGWIALRSPQLNCRSPSMRTKYPVIAKSRPEHQDRERCGRPHRQPERPEPRRTGTAEKAPMHGEPLLSLKCRVNAPPIIGTADGDRQDENSVLAVHGRTSSFERPCGQCLQLHSRTVRHDFS
jgi:hypothetical protein